MNRNEKKTIITVVPALPGFDVVELCHGDHIAFSYAPVVAWAVHVYVEVDPTGDQLSTGSHSTPVCVDQYFGRDNEIVRQPDGSIVFMCERTFGKGQEAEALAYAVERYKKSEEEMKLRIARKAGEAKR